VEVDRMSGWRKSTLSTTNGCVEVHWHKSTHSVNNGCVEVAFAKSSHSSSGSCVEVGVARTSSHSSSGGCVEVEGLAEGWIAVRDSKDREGPVLRFNPTEWEAFLAGVRGGEFDLAQ
jgi:hypothetical protein